MKLTTSPTLMDCVPGAAFSLKDRLIVVIMFLKNLTRRIVINGAERNLQCDQLKLISIEKKVRLCQVKLQATMTERDDNLKRIRLPT
jgi:hypothetical protein